MFGGFDVYVHQYPTHHFQGRFEIQHVANRMLAELRQQAQLDKYADVIFIAHSMGGLVVRQALAGEGDSNAIRDKTRAIFLFSTPISGSGIATVGRSLGLLSNAAAQMGKDPDFEDAYPNVLKRSWIEKQISISIPAFCAFESERTHGVMVVPRSRAEGLCDRALVKLNGDHNQIVLPEPVRASRPRTYNGAHMMLRNWMSTLYKDMQDAVEQDVSKRVIVAYCTGRLVYEGVYGGVNQHTLHLLNDLGRTDARISYPLPSVWLSSFTKRALDPPSIKASDADPILIVVHFSCFQAGVGAAANRERDRNFVNFLKAFRGTNTRFLVYSRVFVDNTTSHLSDKMREYGVDPDLRRRVYTLGFPPGQELGISPETDQKFKDLAREILSR
jgi:pimeloyl-ACP methyl ester carboxylesterase